MSVFENYHQVKLDSKAMLSRRASVIGDVAIGENSTVFAGAQIRGDEAAVRIGANTNIQENTVVHTDHECPTHIGNYVTVGHAAIVHGCTIEDQVLIGMGAIVMDNAVIGTQSLVAAGALVTQGKVFEPRSLIVGSPAKAVRSLSDEEVETLMNSATHYVETGQAMLADKVMINPAEGTDIWE